MIAACPRCGAKYRVDAGKIGADGARLRCAKCEAVFRVRAPEPAPAAAPAAAVEPAGAGPAAPQAPEPAAPSPAPAPAPRAPAPAPAPISPSDIDPATVDREKLVLVADPNVEAGKASVATLAAHGLQPVLVHDGVEAMMAIQRLLPRAVVLDAALPKMYGFQICEFMKRNDSLRDPRVVLVGAIHHRDRYRRPPTDLYGADEYMEQPDMPDGLVSVLQRFGMLGGSHAAMQPPLDTGAPSGGGASAAAAPVGAGVESRAEVPVQAAPVQAPAGDGLDDARANAERLARIIVSDIVLYHPEKFEEALRVGNVVDVLESAIEEGRAFFQQRVDAAVAAEKDHLVEELLRVARERGMQ